MTLKSVTERLTTALVESITAAVEDKSCKEVNNVNSSALKCDFVLNTEDCDYDGVFFPYTVMTYCTLEHQRALAIVILFLLLLFLFFCMGIVADDFLCPSLLAVSKTFRLPDHIAGVTFLAFGNGAPDIFSSIGGIQKTKPHLILSSLYGGGIFVTTLVTGSVLIAGNFTLMKRPILRDIVFYIGAAFIVWIFVFSTVISLGKSITLIAYYISYISAVIIGRYIYVRLNPEKPQRSGSDQIAVIDPESSISQESTSDNKPGLLSYEQNGVVLTRFHKNGTNRSKNRTESDGHPVHHHFENSILHISNIFETEYQTKTIEKKESITPSSYSKTGLPKPFLKQDSVLSILSRESFVMAFNETKDFIVHISPIDTEEWPEMTWYSKILAVIKAVPYFIMTICIPVVDLESENENWCRLLICLNMFLAPQMTLFFLQKTGIEVIFSIPLWGVCLIISAIISLAILLTSEKNKPPIYHRGFALIGFVVAVILINSTADEIISVLKTLGVTFDLSDSILGLTVLAWGNSLGDLIADMSLARAGYPAMAISACFAGPMLNLLMGLGIPYTLKFSGEKDSKEVYVEYTNMMTLLFSTLTMSLLISLFYFVFNRFNSSKIHGILLISLYVIYTVIAFLIEFDVLPK